MMVAMKSTVLWAVTLGSQREPDILKERSLFIVHLFQIQADPDTG